MSALPRLTIVCCASACVVMAVVAPETSVFDFSPWEVLSKVAIILTLCPWLFAPKSKVKDEPTGEPPKVNALVPSWLLPVVDSLLPTAPALEEPPAVIIVTE